ncbi:hypothetical protein EJ08DRAFT_664634 [Tothia fuscella]|uniref:Uncharacterized protein n=1 Tax=Tothia fuscella TaxID=1048955 RepID=A0A9P4NI96_9PEZI|nr:hypothetical protein EJ08DRAFT_664634 [Tothia fuscella]
MSYSTMGSIVKTLRDVFPLPPPPPAPSELPAPRNPVVGPPPSGAVAWKPLAHQWQKTGVGPLMTMWQLSQRLLTPIHHLQNHYIQFFMSFISSIGLLESILEYSSIFQAHESRLGHLLRRVEATIEDDDSPRKNLMLCATIHPSTSTNTTTNSSAKKSKCLPLSSSQPRFTNPSSFIAYPGNYYQSREKWLCLVGSARVRAAPHFFFGLALGHQMAIKMAKGPHQALGLLHQTSHQMAVADSHLPAIGTHQMLPTLVNHSHSRLMGMELIAPAFVRGQTFPLPLETEDKADRRVSTVSTAWDNFCGLPREAAAARNVWPPAPQETRTVWHFTTTPIWINRLSAMLAR